jgi:flagellar biosynthesis protein FlhB
VVVNPIHFAVALSYDQDQMGAPRVVAKGQLLLAERIKTVAQKANVPIVENIPLARSLYSTVEVGHEVPAALFQAVAEVLAFVYRLKRRSW